MHNLSSHNTRSNGAIISDCGQYRYELWRQVSDEGRGEVCFVMLNPSTADALKDDPTIRKCIGFARRWGFARLRVVNLFAYRATDPRELKRHCMHQAFGPHNDQAWRNIVTTSDRIVVAWGASLPAYAPIFVQSFLGEIWGDIWCLGRSKHGHPRHPLMLPYTAVLEPFGRE